VKRSLPSECRRILEVGCGTGELAARLVQDGQSVIAIDSDPEAVAAARQLGVNAHVGTWPDFEQGRFDAVLFTRSLHHIHPLDRSVRHAADSLADGGRIIVEDFAYESADEKTLHWFGGAVRLLEATGSLTASDDLLKRVLSKTETMKAWRENHENELHTAAEIWAQLRNSLGCVVRENAAYYFRYIASAISLTEKRDETLSAFAEQEQALARDGSIVALGRRFVASR
jgi:SAM-dependent methyltransferase